MCSNKRFDGAGVAPTVSGVTSVLTGMDGTLPSEFQKKTHLQFDSTNFGKSAKGCDWMYNLVVPFLRHENSTPAACRYLTFNGSKVPRNTMACSNAMVQKSGAYVKHHVQYVLTRTKDYAHVP